MNSARGELSFDVEGKRYTLAFTVNALIAIEDALHCPIPEFAERFKQRSLGLKDMRTVFRCGLVDFHGEVDDMEAGRLMTAVGMGEAIRLITEAVAAAFPRPDDTPAVEAPKGPLPGLPGHREPATGSRASARGASSTSTPSNTGATRPA